MLSEKERHRKASISWSHPYVGYRKVDLTGAESTVVAAGGRGVRRERGELISGSKFPVGAIDLVLGHSLETTESYTPFISKA